MINWVRMQTLYLYLYSFTIIKRVYSSSLNREEKITPCGVRVLIPLLTLAHHSILKLQYLESRPRKPQRTVLCGFDSLSWSNWNLEYGILGREENRRTERYIIGARREPTTNSTLDRHQPLAPLVGEGRGGEEGRQRNFLPMTDA